MDDVITIRISRRSIRLFLVGSAVFLVLGFVLPVVLASLGRGHSPDGKVKPIQVQP